MKEEQIRFVELASEMFAPQCVMDRGMIQQVVNKNKLTYPYWFTKEPEYKVENGKYRLPNIGCTKDSSRSDTDMLTNSSKDVAETIDRLSAPPLDGAPVNILRRAQLHDESVPIIPDHFPGYVPFGFYNDMKSLLVSKLFFPVMIVGLSGNGKTLMPLEAAYEIGRPLIRVNMSIETDENQLLGGTELVDGNTVNRKGPVLLAMEQGAILLLDEIDRSSNKLMCLQGILEGNAYYDKNTGKLYRPAEGFTIIATANTKGKGSSDGRYLASIIDDAFLERFPITIEQDFPHAETEQKILNNVLTSLQKEDEDFTRKLVQWGGVVRKAYSDNSINELISTRRLVDICKTFAIYGDRMKAITYCTNRFDEESKAALVEFYTAIDGNVISSKDIPENKGSVADIWLEVANKP